jgi:hypothetical protein
MADRRLHGPAAVSNAAATKYTTPAGTRARVRHIHVSNTSAGPVNFTLSIGADAAGTRIFDAYTIAAGAVLDHYGLYVLAAAEIIQAFGSVLNQLVLTIDGDEELV